MKDSLHEVFDNLNSSIGRLKSIINVMLIESDREDAEIVLKSMVAARDYMEKYMRNMDEWNRKDADMKARENVCNMRVEECQKLIRGIGKCLKEGDVKKAKKLIMDNLPYISNFTASKTKKASR